MLHKHPLILCPKHPTPRYTSEGSRVRPFVESMPSSSSNRTTPQRAQRERSRSPTREMGSGKVHSHHDVVASHPHACLQHAPDVPQHTMLLEWNCKTLRENVFVPATRNRCDAVFKRPLQQKSSGWPAYGWSCVIRASCFVLRASCFVLRASCPLAPFGPLTPVGTDRVRSRHLSTQSLTHYPLSYVTCSMFVLLTASTPYTADPKNTIAIHPLQAKSPALLAAEKVVQQSQREEEARRAKAAEMKRLAGQMRPPPPHAPPKRLAPAQLSYEGASPPATPMDSEFQELAGGMGAEPEPAMAQQGVAAEGGAAGEADAAMAEERRRQRAAVIDNDPAFLRIFYPTEVARDDRVVLSEGAILKELNTACMMLGMHNISERTITVRLESSTGPASIFGFSAKECSNIIDENSVIVIDGKTKDGTPSQGILEVDTYLVDLRAELGIDKSEDDWPTGGISYMASYRRTPVNHINKFTPHLQGGVGEVPRSRRATIPLNMATASPPATY